MTLSARNLTNAMSSLMKDLIARTRELFHEGLPLAKMVEGKLAIDLEMFSRGGLAVLDAIEAMGYDTLHQRPSVSKGKQVRLLGRAVVTHVLGGGPAAVPKVRAIAVSAGNAPVAMRESQPPTRNAIASPAKRIAIFIRHSSCCQRPSATASLRSTHSCA